MRAARASAVARRHEQGGLVVGADDLGQRAAGGGDERHAARHGLDGRQREALVERRHDGQLGLAVQLVDPLVGDAGDELDAVLEAEPARSSRPTCRPPCALPMTTRLTSRSVRSLASASSR